ncbi:MULTISPECIES: hypothetical protein [Actinosynnema]|nr:MULTISPECIES: hypothetical protein [Actinosynnema]AXX29698.1 hypothetical protein APASM_2333 [Actinosynnema pretiosum subsp. pretiosum]QUF06079.1 hypothetical protein KCV87_08485 [Actinosynnema pretiosum subsp. pretiosum]
MRLLLWMTMTCWSAVDGGVVLPALTGFLLVVCAADNALAVRDRGSVRRRLTTAARAPSAN